MTKNKLTPGLWESFKSNKKMIIQGHDLHAALVISLLIWWITPYQYSVQHMQFITHSFLAVSGTLLGIVLAGLSIMVAFFDDKYLNILSKVPPGIDADFFPFWFTGLLAVSSITLDFLWIFLERIYYPHIKSIAIWLIIFLFLWTLFATFELILALRAHGYLKILLLDKLKENQSDEKN